MAESSSKTAKELMSFLMLLADFEAVVEVTLSWIKSLEL
jgi:hypothetical protein